MKAHLPEIMVTGCGWVTPFAAGNIPQVLGSMDGLSTRANSESGFWGVSDAVLTQCPEVPDDAKKETLVHLAAVALQLARRDAGAAPLPYPSQRVGLVLGCALAGLGGMIDFANDVRAQTARFVSPLRFPQTVGNYLTGALARYFDVRGPSLTLANGICAGVDAVLEGAALLASGHADLVFAGGVDRLTPTVAIGLTAGKSEGAMLSEGACVLVLERRADVVKRSARPLARIILKNELAKPSIVFQVGSDAPGAIEKWVGNCFAALGVSAVAAAIGAVNGIALPPALHGAESQAAPRQLAAVEIIDGNRHRRGLAVQRAQN